MTLTAPICLTQHPSRHGLSVVPDDYAFGDIAGVLQIHVGNVAVQVLVTGIMPLGKAVLDR